MPDKCGISQAGRNKQTDVCGINKDILPSPSFYTLFSHCYFALFVKTDLHFA